MPRISEQVAVARMRERGAQPLDPFPGTQMPWRCRCFTCGAVSSPRYNDVVNKGTGVCRGACRSQKIAEKLSLDTNEAEALMRLHGWEPLENYPGAGKLWRSQCVTCGIISGKKLAHVQKGRGGCKHCLGMVVTDTSASKIMNLADLEPLVSYPGSQAPWLSRCRLCGHFTQPTYSHVKARGHQCWNCRGGKISVALRFGDAEARAMMHDAGLEPLAAYPGSMAPWKSRCLGCESTVTPTLHGIRSGQGGCARCAGRGIDLTKDGYLYLVVHDEREALKVGIANSEQRLRQHGSAGWRLVARWNAEIAQDAREIERATLQWFRNIDIPYAFERGEMKYRGYTETASLSDIASDDVVEFIGRFANEYLRRVA